MPAVVVFTGLACGVLLATAGLALWADFRQSPGISRAMWAISWLAGVFLLMGALLAWQGDHSVPPPGLRLILMAALAAPLGIHRRRLPPRNYAMLILPALILAGAGLFWVSRPVASETFGAPVLPKELAIVVCGGLGARALGEALSMIAAPPSPKKSGGTEAGLEWSSAATYALLTLLVGGTALANLWQRGTMWGGTAGEGGLAGAWLAWIAAWPVPRQRPRLRAGLTIVAALLLISVVLAYT